MEAGRAFLASVLALGVSGFVGYVLAALSAFGVLLLLAGFLAGGFYGELYLRLVSRKRGTVVEAIGIGAGVAGLLLGGFAYFVAAYGASALPAMLLRPLYLVSIGCFLFSTIGRLRL